MLWVPRRYDACSCLVVLAGFWEQQYSLVRTIRWQAKITLLHDVSVWLFFNLPVMRSVNHRPGDFCKMSECKEFFSSQFAVVLFWNSSSCVYEWTAMVIGSVPFWLKLVSELCFLWLRLSIIEILASTFHYSYLVLMAASMARLYHLRSSRIIHQSSVWQLARYTMNNLTVKQYFGK